MLMEKIELFFPEKTIKVNEDDKAWISPALKKLDRQRKREYNRNKKSKKWRFLNMQFEEKSKDEKVSYYENMVEDLKTSNPGQWYSKIKRMSQLDPTKLDHVSVDELNNLSDAAQAKAIAENFGKIANLYEPLKKENIQIPEDDQSRPLPLFEAFDVWKKIKTMKKKKSTVKGDIPWRIITEFSVELSSPLCNIFNTGTLNGEWPNIWKFEYVTPAPKVYPPVTKDDLRKISGTKNFSKIYEALISETILSDMTPKMDKAQYGNQKGLSIQHYLVNMVNKILTILDTNNAKEKYAVIATLVDWSKAFDMQDPTLGIQSFIRNGVRPCLIPVLINYFQDRKMIVKWKGIFSTTQDLPGGGPQGATMGLIEYMSNSNNNTDHISSDMKFKFVDDLSALELLNLILLGLSSYNFKSHVASDIGIGQHYIPSENIKSQENLNKIEAWTNENKMKLNSKKSKVMVFNFTTDFQFATRLYIEDSLLETVTETKLLGTIIQSDLKWHSNTDMLVKKGYQRMLILKKLYEFNVPVDDMVTIYVLFLRSILEQSCVVWHTSITEEEASDLERVQKVAFKVILKDRYERYEQALGILNLKKLTDRRSELCLRFAKKCLKMEKTKDMFPLNDCNQLENRHREKYFVQHASTGRLYDSAIPQMQRALNEDAASKSE